MSVTETQKKQETNFEIADIINKLRGLIQKYRELMEKKTDLNDILKDKERFSELLNVIGEILEVLRQSSELNNETIEKIYNIYQNIMERYNNLYKQTIENELIGVGEDTKLYTTPQFPFSEYGIRQPEDEELKKIPVDIEKVDEENKSVSFTKREIVKLNVDIDILTGALNKVIDIINNKYNIVQEQVETEVISPTDLVTIEKKSWLHKFFDKIKTFFGSKEKIVADVPYEEVDSKNKEFVKNLRIEEKNDSSEEVSPKNKAEREKKFREDWNNRLIEYRRKIDEGVFSVQDVPDFIEDLYRIDGKENGDIRRNKNALIDRLEQIKKILAKYFKCKEKDIYIGDILFKQREYRIVPYKVILGDADFSDSKVEHLGNLQFVGGSVNFKKSPIENLGKLKCIKGNANFNYSRVRNLGQLQSIGGNASFENDELISLGNLQTIGGNVDFTNSQVMDLGKLQSIGGNVNFDSSKLKNLGQLKNIGGDVNFNFSKVVDLGQLQSIGGNVRLDRMAELISLGQLKSIGGSACFETSKLRSLGQLQQIGGSAYFDGSEVIDLDQLQSIGGDADFSDSKVEHLGNLQRIGGDAIFEDSHVKDLGQLQIIGKKIIWGRREDLKEQYENRKKEEASDKKIEENISDKDDSGINR